MSLPVDVTVRLRGETLRLMPERAAFWPARSTLLVADAHIGKAASFRAAGVPVPRGTTSATLARLSRAIERCGADRVVFLGDLLHSAAGRQDATLEAMSRWRATHRELALVLVRGNHDAHAGDPPAALDIAVHAGALHEGPFSLRHEHHEAAGDHERGDAARGYPVAGHMHPAVRIGARGDSLRLPCFWFTRGYALLPAFGEFTGTALIGRGNADRAYAVAEDRVMKV